MMSSVNATAKVTKYELRDVLRSRWVIGYGLFFLVITEALFKFGGTGSQVLLSLLNVVLILIPLVSVIFGTMYLYSAREFIELMLSQPIRRSNLFLGLYTGLAFSLIVSFLIGLLIPFVIHGAITGPDAPAVATMLVAGVLLTLIFVSMAFLIATGFDDRVKGLGIALVTWLFFSILYDGLVLLLVNAFSDYPLEKPIIAMTVLNPVDLARVLLLLKFDISALMGYTGAVFERFFGSSTGIFISVCALMVWFIIPLFIGRRVFKRKSF